MPTVTVKTDGGGDYPSLSQAFSGEQSTTGDLEILCAGVAADSAATMGAMAADSVTIRADPNDAAGQYKGNGFWSTSHYRIEGTSDRALRINGVDNVTIIGLQISNNSGQQVIWLNGGNLFKLQSLRVDQQANNYTISDDSDDGLTDIESCTIWTAATTVSRANIETSGIGIRRVANCALISTSGTNEGIRLNGPLVNLFNTQFDNLGNDINTFGGITNSGGNATTKASDTTGHIGTTGIVAVTDFVSATDRRAANGGALDNDGVLSELPAVDITNTVFVNANISPYNEIQGAPQDVTKYVDTDVAPGGDGSQGNPYSSVNEWQTAERGTLTANHTVLVSGVAPDATFTISGWGGLSATQRLTIAADPGSAKGRFTGANIELQTTHYRVEKTSGFGYAAEVDQNFTTLRGIQSVTTAASSGHPLGIMNTSNNVLIDGCRLYMQQPNGHAVDIFTTGADNIIQSSIIINRAGVDLTDRIVNLFGGGRLEALRNCYLEGSGNGYGVSLQSDAILNRLANNHFKNNSVDVRDTGTINTASNNATNQGTAPPEMGANPQTGVAVGVDYTSATDIRPVTGGKLDNTGLAGEMPTEDVVGAAFANDNIGPYNELVGAPTPTGYAFGYVIS